MRNRTFHFVVIFAVVLAVLSVLFIQGAAAKGHGKDESREIMYSPTSELGVEHIEMYEAFADLDCTICHNGEFLDAAPSLRKMKKVKMAGKHACVRCHDGSKAPALFISFMNTEDVVYNRCEDCHEVR